MEHPSPEYLQDRTLCSTTPFSLANVGPIASHGGPVIAHVRIEMIFYGNYWNTAAGHQQALQLQQATNDLIGGEYMDGLRQLGVGRGFVDQVDFVQGSSSNNIGNSATTIIRQEINSHHLAGPANDKLFLIIVAPNVHTEGAWHSWASVNNHRAYFAEIPFTFDSNKTPFENETGCITHEVVEAATDPNGHGWYFNTLGHPELCDMAERIQYIGHYDHYEASPYWLALGHAAP